MLKIQGDYSHFWQWDTGRRLIVGETACSTVYFSNGTTEKALAVEVKEANGVRTAAVPDLFLQIARPLTAYVVLHGADEIETRFALTFPVYSRAKPYGYISTDDEILTWASLDERIKILEDGGVPADKVEEAVADYLAENPVQAGATPEQAAQIQANKEAIEQLQQGNGNESTETTDDVFVATYGQTTNAEMWEANQAGKLILCHDAGTDNIFSVFNITETKAWFSGYAANSGSLVSWICDNDAWSAGTASAAGTVKSVNGVSPDANGNVQIDVGSDSSQNVELDTTLTVKGKAADAKAVGDKFAEITGISLIEPAYGDIPKIFFGAPLQTTKDEIVCKFWYFSKTLTFTAWAEIKMQGNSTTMWAKKNQTVKLFADEACTEKLKIDFKGWGEQNKFVIKAYWNDITHTRDIVSVRLESECARTRSDYSEMPEEIRTSPNMGAVDGFPVLVWADGIYQGRYMWNIPKDKWMNNMDDELETHCMLVSEDYDSGCFRSAAKIDESDWTDEIHDTVPDSIKTRWNEVITFVQTATDDEFRANLGNYINVNSLIDRHLMGLYSCDYDGYGKNQRYDTYDGQLWYAVPYDKDGTWGCYWNGSQILPSNYDRIQYEDMIQDRPGNLLFIRLEQMFWPEMQERWPVLKAGPLSIANTINRFRELYDITPPHIIAEDYAATTAGGAFTAMPQVENLTAQQFQTFVVERHAWMDEYVAGLKYVPCTGISLSASTLTFSSGEPQTLTATVTPEDCTENVIWESNNTEVATVSGGVVTPVANGNCNITATCGKYSASCAVSVAGATLYNVTNNLTNVTTDNESTTAAGNGSYTATLTAASDEYALDTVTVTMGGVDITETAYSDGVITIENVTGDIVITATAKTNPVLYTATNFAISDNYWEDGTKYYNRDSRIKLLENDIDFTVVFDAVSPIDAPTRYDGRAIAMTNYISVLVAFNGTNLKVNYHGGSTTSVAMDNAMKTGDRVRAIATHIAGSETMNVYVRITNDTDGTDKTYTAQSTGTWATYDGTIQAQSGVFQTIDEFTVYNYAMTADEANAWLAAE